jgi:hypothetical protein
VKWLLRTFEYPRYAFLFLAGLIAVVVFAATYHYKAMAATVGLMVLVQLAAWFWPRKRRYQPYDD